MSYVPLLSSEKFLEFFNKRINIEANPPLLAAFRELRKQLAIANEVESEKGRDPLFLNEVRHIDNIVVPQIDPAYLQG